MSDFKRSDREPKVLVREPQHLCPNCGDDRTGKGSLIDTTTPGQAFCDELCVMEWQAKRIKELERHNEFLRAVAKKANEYAGYDVVGGRGYVDRQNLRDCLQAAIDGGALDKDGEK